VADGAPQRVISRLTIVCALGYFVDIYDLILFAIVRRPSLLDLGVAEADLLQVGGQLLSWQMGGMLIGGIAWGVLGDKRGRKSILFGSIALYSVANLANAIVTDLTWYAALRFIAGLGLAGELGAAVTLVSEALPAHLRGYGTMLVSAIGILGAVAGYFVADLFDWRIAYVVGGVLGLVLLAARFGIAESAMFRTLEARVAGRGDLRLFIGSHTAHGFAWFRGNGDRLRRLLLTALVGIPIWCVIGILITFSPEIAEDVGASGGVDAGTMVVLAYAGASAGSLASGTLSQWMKSRRIAVHAFLALTILAAGALLLLGGAPSAAFYTLAAVLGLGAGYWAVFVQMGAEQFGTDLRATVATANPNLVRGSVVLLVPAYHALAGAMSLAAAAVLLLGITVLLAQLATWRLRETFGVELDFLEGTRSGA
jgi:MFS family permease